MFKPALQFPRAAESPGPATVLFIDDDEGILRTGTGVLQRAGYHVHPAASAEEAWQLWERHKYQFRAIIADNRLQGEVTGLTLLQHFERERPGLARLLVSGYMTPELAQQVFDSTKIRVLLKPFEFPVLVNWLAVELVRADHTQRLQRAAFAAPRSGPLVLLIDDEPMVRRSLELLLVQAGFAPVVAADVPQALLAWEEHREIMSVVVSDYSLGPGRNGLSLLEEFAAERSDLVCILMSAYLTPELIASLSSHSHVHCLAKPFQFAELKRLIDTGLAQRRRSATEAKVG